jgi:hypothetical protein
VVAELVGGEDVEGVKFRRSNNIYVTLETLKSEDLCNT